MASSTTVAVQIFLISLLAFPMTYMVNTSLDYHGEVGLFVSGVVCLLLICLLTYLAVSQLDDKQLQKDWLFYVLTLGTFSAVVDLIFALEADDVVKGFMSAYLERGEPYFSTPHGIMILYWDGTAHFALYIFMLVAMARKWDFRDAGLYWAGSIGHSMLVLLPGALLGVHGVKWSFLLNVPYIFIPFLSGARFLNERKVSVAKRGEGDQTRPVWKRPVDVLLILLFSLLTLIALLRGFAALGLKSGVVVDYVKRYEPYVNDPVAFPRVQMLVYLFYFIPFYIMAIYGLIYESGAWLSDWSLLGAGASAQAQFPYILAAIHQWTSESFRIPPTNHVRTIFFVVNLTVLIVPHILALRCFTRSKTGSVATGLPVGDVKTVPTKARTTRAKKE